MTPQPSSVQPQQSRFPWPVPMAELMQDLDGAGYVWTRLHYVFRLPDPQSLAPRSLQLTAEGRLLLERFVQQARSLAATSLLAATDSVRVSFSDDDDEVTVEENFSADDITTGFMVQLRQCFADDEEASFSKARKLLARSFYDAGDTAATQTLKLWREAHGALGNTALDELAQEQMIKDGMLPATIEDPDGNRVAPIVRAPASPRELLQTLWYGGQIHWGKNREPLAEIEADPFDAGMWQISARQAGADLAHFYMGFALLVERVLEKAATGEA
jgi:hypothetical protein